MFKVVLVTLVLSLNFKIPHGLKIIEPFSEENVFNVYWNVPTFQCRSHKIYFENLVQKFNIIQNKDDSFKGDKMTILYDPGNFPAILNDEDSNIQFLRNGGVPQEGNLTDHLIQFEDRVITDIPKINYDGVAVIDFESWRPTFRQNWATLLPYKKLSIDMERKRHPFWDKSELTKEATRRFEIAGRQFVETTMILARSLRPNATWGYYAYPYCFNMVNGTMQATCGEEVQNENNNIMWMFESSNSLHPSLYLPEKRLNNQQRVELIEGRIMESLRINNKLLNEKKIIPYFWYAYQDTQNFLSRDDMRNSFIVLKSFNIDGVIIWGSSNDVNTKEKCQRLYSYVEKTLGPIIVST